MICYFWECFKPSIKVEIEQQDRESMNFEKMMLKIVNVEAKVGLRFSTMAQDSHIRCSRGYRPSNSIASKMQTKRTTTKDSYPEEPKIKETRPTLSRAEASKLSKQARKERKKKKHQKRWDKEQTPASTANTIEVQ